MQTKLLLGLQVVVFCTDDKEKAEMFKKLRKHGEREMLGYNSKMLLMNIEFINFRLSKMKEWQQKRARNC